MLTTLDSSTIRSSFHKVISHFPKNVSPTLIPVGLAGLIGAAATGSWAVGAMATFACHQGYRSWAKEFNHQLNNQNKSIKFVFASSLISLATAGVCFGRMINQLQYLNTPGASCI